MKEDYEKFLKSKKVVELKNIARSYIKHIKFAFTGVKKDELIKHLLKHTMLEDGQIKVVDSVVPIKVLIKGRSEDNVKKLIDESDFEIRDREKIRNLLLGQKGQFSGRIFRFQRERDDLIEKDKDNTKKKHTKEIDEYNKQIEETKKQLKIVNALIVDFNKKLDEKIQEKKAMKEEPKKEVIKEESARLRYVSDNTGYNVDGSIQEWKIEEIKKTNEVLEKLGYPDFWKNPYKILDEILGKKREVRQILVDDKSKSFKNVSIKNFEDGIIEFEFGMKTPNGFGKEQELFNRVTKKKQKVFVPPLHSYLIYSNGKVSGGIK
jgi:hypothetical protein